MATPSSFSLLQSPLCSTQIIKDLVETGSLYDEKHGKGEIRERTAQLEGLRQGRSPDVLGKARGSIYIAYTLKLVFESLHQALIQGPQSLQNLLSVLEAKVDSQQRTWEQVVGGESAEFNQMLERLIDQRLQQRQETAQAGLQDLVQDITTRRQEIRANPAQKTEIFRDAMQNLRRALPADDDPQRQAVLNQLIEQVAQLGLEVISDQQ